MKRSEAIEVAEISILGCGESFHVSNKELMEATHSYKEKQKAIKILCSTTKQVEEVVGKIDEEIDRIDKTGIVISNRYEALKCIRKMLTEEE